MPGLLAQGETGGWEGVGTHPGCPLTPLHSGSRFKGHQQSKGNKYQVEVVFKVSWREYDVEDGVTVGRSVGESTTWRMG